MKRRMMSMFLIVNLFLGIIPLAIAQFPEAGVEKFRVPVEAPDFTLRELGGGKISLKDLRGKIILLNFFTTW